jgi:hypothetical protein
MPTDEVSDLILGQNHDIRRGACTTCMRSHLMCTGYVEQDRSPKGITLQVIAIRTKKYGRITKCLTSYWQGHSKLLQKTTCKSKKKGFQSLERDFSRPLKTKSFLIGLRTLDTVKKMELELVELAFFACWNSATKK